MRAMLMAGVALCLVGSPAVAQPEPQCTSCPTELSLTPAQWSCLTPRLADLKQSVSNPVFVPLPEAPNCTATLAAAPRAGGTATTKAQKSGSEVVRSFTVDSASLTKSQVDCLSRRQGADTIVFAQC